MRNQFLIITCILFFIFMLSSCQNAVVEINEEIQSNMKSVKKLLSIVTPHIEEYWVDKTFHLGEVFMILNEDLNGEIKLTFADESSKDTPNVIEVNIDTVNNIILNIKNLGRDSKVNPGKINFNKWTLDSIDAFNITKKIFKDELNFKFDVVLIDSTNNYQGDKEVWTVKLNDLDNNIIYWSSIDPYTGQVLKYGIRNVD